jgi:hypothetical protein
MHVLCRAFRRVSHERAEMPDFSVERRAQGELAFAAAVRRVQKCAGQVKRALAQLHVCISSCKLFFMSFIPFTP